MRSELRNNYYRQYSTVHKQVKVSVGKNTDQCFQFKKNEKIKAKREHKLYIVYIIPFLGFPFIISFLGFFHTIHNRKNSLPLLSRQSYF